MIKTNKEYVILLVAVTMLFVFTDAVKKSTGAHPSSTMAPGEQSCNISGCHANATLSDGSSVNKLVLNGTTDTYEPGKTYDLTLTATRANIKRFGFQIVALKDEDNSNIGEFKITQDDRTQVQTGAGALSTRIYVTHKLNGTPAITTGFNEWKFSWTAPAKNEGPISFYYVTNCTNNNNMATGDALFNSRFIIKPGSSAISEKAAAYHLTTHYDRIQKNIVIGYELDKAAVVRVTVFDATGRLIKTTDCQQIVTGSNNVIIDAAGITSGIYYIHIVINGAFITSKLVIL
jgi:hypothetical protein